MLMKPQNGAEFQFTGKGSANIDIVSPYPFLNVQRFVSVYYLFSCFHSAVIFMFMVQGFHSIYLIIFKRNSWISKETNLLKEVQQLTNAVFDDVKHFHCLVACFNFFIALNKNNLMVLYCIVLCR